MAVAMDASTREAKPRDVTAVDGVKSWGVGASSAACLRGLTDMRCPNNTSVARGACGVKSKPKEDFLVCVNSVGVRAA
jgi:hypothetical protein